MSEERRECCRTFAFGMQINIKVIYKLILSFWVFVTRHVQSTQNKKFAYLCNISRKAWLVDFLPVDKLKNFLKDDCFTFGVHSQLCPKYPKQQACNILGKH